MKALNSVFFSTLILAVGCSSDKNAPSPTGSSTSSTTSASSGSFWTRSDGVNAQLSLSGTVAKTCNNGVETTGTYNSAEPSMTYVSNGTTVKFPLKFDGNALLVGVPSQAINTNNATYYDKITSYNCSGSSGGSTPPATIPPLGYFKVRIYDPIGSCANGSTTVRTGVLGTLVIFYYVEVTKQYVSSSVSLPSISGSDSDGKYFEALYNFNTGAYKIEWDLRPNKSGTIPSSCLKKGSTTIDTKGQTKTVTISW